MSVRLLLGELVSIEKTGESEVTIYIQPEGVQRQKVWFEVSAGVARSLKIGDNFYCVPESHE